MNVAEDIAALRAHFERQLNAAAARLQFEAAREEQTALWAEEGLPPWTPRHARFCRISAIVARAYANAWSEALR